MNPSNSNLKITIGILAALGIIAAGAFYFYQREGGGGDTLLKLDNQTNVIDQKNTKVTLKTNYGDIEIELFPDKAPLTVANFIKLSQEKFYDGTKFHRVIPDFMIQGGDPLSREANWSLHGTGGPGYTFADEPNDVALVRGVLAMANAGPNTNGSQFFIITAEATPWLQGKHTGFGRVTSGMEVVDVINKVERNQNDHPLKDVVIKEVVLR